MANQRRIIIVLAFCSFLLVLPFETTNNLLIPVKNQQTIPSAIDITQMIPDPELNSEPDAYVHGTSGEFEYSYGSGVIVLNWTHERETPLDYRAEDDSTYPSYNDYVYFTQ